MLLLIFIFIVFYYFNYLKKNEYFIIKKNKMETIDKFNLQLLLQENNKYFINFLKNEFLYMVKDGIIEDIKKEFYGLLFNEIKKEKAKTCGFGRSRNRGYCKRITHKILCPYHLNMVKENYLNLSLPDNILYGNSSGLIQNNNKYSVIIEDIKDSADMIKDGFLDLNFIDKKIYKKDILNIKIYDYCNANLPILKYDYDKNKIYDIINGNLYYKPCVLNIYDLTIKDIFLNIDNFHSGPPKLICYKNSDKPSNNFKKSKKGKKSKTIEQLFTIFNDKIKNYISHSKFEKEEKKHIKNIINNTLNKTKLQYYKKDVNIYIYDSGIIIYREIEKYIEKNITHDINYFNLFMRNVVIFYKIFSLMADEDSTDEEKQKMKPKLDEFIFKALKDF